MEVSRWYCTAVPCYDIYLILIPCITSWYIVTSLKHLFFLQSDSFWHLHNNYGLVMLHSSRPEILYHDASVLSFP